MKRNPLNAGGSRDCTQSMRIYSRGSLCLPGQARHPNRISHGLLRSLVPRVKQQKQAGPAFYSRRWNKKYNEKNMYNAVIDHLSFTGRPKKRNDGICFPSLTLIQMHVLATSAAVFERCDSSVSFSIIRILIFLPLLARGSSHSIFVLQISWKAKGRTDS